MQCPFFSVQVFQLTLLSSFPVFKLSIRNWERPIGNWLIGNRKTSYWNFFKKNTRKVAQSELDDADYEKILGIAVITFISFITLVFYFFVKNTQYSCLPHTYYIKHNSHPPQVHLSALFSQLMHKSSTIQVQPSHFYTTLAQIIHTCVNIIINVTFISLS